MSLILIVLHFNRFNFIVHFHHLVVNVKINNNCFLPLKSHQMLLLQNQIILDSNFCDASLIDPQHIHLGFQISRSFVSSQYHLSILCVISLHLQIGHV